MNKLKIFNLAAGIGAIFSLVFYMIVNLNNPTYIIEPVWWIRIPEIIIGLISMPILIKIILEEIRK